MSLNIPGLSASPVFVSEITFACWLSHDTVLCYGPLQHSLSANDTMLVNGLATRKPYLGTILNESGTRNVLLLLTLENPESVQYLREVTVSDGTSEIQWQYHAEQPLEDLVADVPQFCERFTQPNLRKILFLLLSFLSSSTRSASHPRFATICHHVRRALDRSETPMISHTAWILPDILYVEGELAAGLQGPLRLVISSQAGVYASRVETMELQESPDGSRTHVSIAFFPKGTHEQLHKGNITVLSSNQLIPVAGSVATAKAGLALLLTRLNALDDQTRQRVREHINAQLLANVSKASAEAVSAVVRNLQYYLPTAHTSIFEPESPFGMNIEQLFPIGHKAFFISGWLRDPLEMLEEIEAVSDLGFIISILPYLKHYPKDGVDALYENAPTNALRGSWGFVARVPLDSETQKRIENIASLHSFRFEVRLKGGLHYSITPDQRIFEPFYARDYLLSEIAPATELNREADDCVRLAAAEIQALCMKQVRVKSHRVYGKATTKPKVTVVIPIYRCIAYLRTQIAHFSNDDFMHECQIVYVLDSPEQEKEVSALFEEYAALYRLPMTLLVMERSSGYAAASNAGAAIAQAPYLLMLNSDVLPIQYGWLKSMLQTYQRIPGIGALGPKLLYEDDSIQHAGMYFTDATLRPYVENRHYFKGYPSNYPDSENSRDVPAVTGACLMISASHWKKTGGYSTDYIIGDFEDSDLCLKLSAQKLKHYYLAAVELYHLERQSIQLHEAYRRGAAHRYNAALHHERWAKAVYQLMKRYVRS